MVREHAPRLERGRAHVPRGRDVGCVVDEAVGSLRVGLVACQRADPAQLRGAHAVAAGWYPRGIRITDADKEIRNIGWNAGGQRN